MTCHPLSGRVRIPALATAVLLASVAGIGAADTSADAAPRSTTALSTYVRDHRDQALSCSLATSPGSRGLQPWPATVRNRVAAQFDMPRIGGYRKGVGRSDHYTGHAIDVMVRGEHGTEIADWFRANAEQLNVKYVIWEQGYWHPGMTQYRPMEDRGGDTANHFDHVHVSFKTGRGTCPAI